MFFKNQTLAYKYQETHTRRRITIIFVKTKKLKKTTYALLLLLLFRC